MPAYNMPDAAQARDPRDGRRGKKRNARPSCVATLQRIAERKSKARTIRLAVEPLDGVDTHVPAHVCGNAESRAAPLQPYPTFDLSSDTHNQLITK